MAENEKQEKSQFGLREEEVLKFWEDNKIFEKSMKQSEGRPFFSFYDGPPFLSGKPHYGHMLATAIKDTIARHRTMKGFDVPRRVGWDCHGLPVENQIEQELNLKSKKQIEEIGVGKFNRSAKDYVHRHLQIFTDTLKRVGRWADYENAYMTLDNDYIESVWWVLKQLWDQGLVYKDFRVTPYCPRCGTPLSNFEVNQGYKDAVDPAIFIKFKVKNTNNEYFLAWTTTPWTLTSNTALAVGSEIDYVKISRNGEMLILAKERLSVIDGDYEIKEEMKGKDLLGIDYEPLYDFVKPDRRAHFVVSADYVSTEDGTGIVHTAPAFGAEDMETGKRNNLPALITVDKEGKFIPEITPWAGVFVKHADKDIIADLEKRGLLYKAEKITHAYPFCWRCDTPLLYYPLDTWYIAVEKLKSDLIDNNQQINWVPEHIKEGRFGKWLEGARDWAFSRNRYWGAPVPIWECQECQEATAIGSLAEIKSLSKKSGNKFFVMRHGEGKHNVMNVDSMKVETSDQYPLTEKGEQEVKTTAETLKDKKIDVIIASDFYRTKQTAQSVAEIIGYPAEEIVYDWRLREVQSPIHDGASMTNEGSYDSYAPMDKKFTERPEGGESLNDIKNRISELLYETDKKYSGKNVLFVSHEYPIWMLFAGASGLDEQQSIKLKPPGAFVGTAELRELNFIPIPHDENYVLDLHKPDIDTTEIPCQKCDGTMKRIDEVFDCWFESGSMPYAQYHYPFENNDLVEKTFPADFIGEGLDQTRGWFYTLHVLATALTQKDLGLGTKNPAFRNVIVNGMILDSKGQKLSKKLRNYTEPETSMDTYGADALRFYLLSSTAMGEDYLFSDKGVQEASRKITMALYNSLNFLKTYFDKDKFGEVKPEDSENILDKWMLVRFNQSAKEVDDCLNNYDLTKGSRVFFDLLDDLTNWYIRRSRERFQKIEDEKDFASGMNTLYFVLLNTLKLIAPFTPFASEHIYQELKKMSGAGKESVHLEDYPIIKEVSDEEKQILEMMVEVRRVVTLGLEARSKANIKVKQPLAKITVKAMLLSGKDQYLTPIKGEINVKEVEFKKDIAEEVELDTNITEELRREGLARELMRNIQDLRKKEGLTPQDKVELMLEMGETGKELVEELVKEFSDNIKKTTNLLAIKFEKLAHGEEIEVGGHKFKIGIKK